MFVSFTDITLKKLRDLLRTIPVEAYIWTAGLIALACTNPNHVGLFDLCLFKKLGLPFCPGCGLGHSISFLFRGQISSAFSAHPLGPFAVFVLVGRILTLSREAITSRKQVIFNP